MNNDEYDLLIKECVDKSIDFRSVLLSFIFGGLIGVVSSLMNSFLISYFGFDEVESSSIVFMIFVFIGCLLTGLGLFDRLLNIFKCGLIVPSTGFANSMTSPCMDSKYEGFIKGIGSSMFKLAGSIIIYGCVFGIIFGFIRGLI